MAQIDGLIARMTEKSVDTVHLIAEQAGRIVRGQQVAPGPTLTALQLQSLVAEVLPPSLRQEFAAQNKISFRYDSPHGPVDIAIVCGEIWEVWLKPADTRLNSTPPTTPASTPFSGPIATSSFQYPASSPQNYEVARPVRFRPGLSLNVGSPVLCVICAFSHSIQTARGIQPLSVTPLIAAGDMGGSVTVWNGKTGERLWLLKQGQGPLSNIGGVTAVAFSPDGRYIASAHRSEVRLWDVANGTLKAVFKDNAAVLRAMTGSSTGYDILAYAPDGQSIVTTNVRGSIKVRNALTGAIEKSFEHNGPLNNSTRLTRVAYSGDGRTLVSTFFRKLKVWDVDSGACCLEMELDGDMLADILALSLAPDGRTAATGAKTTGNESKARLWDLFEGTQRPLTGHQKAVPAVAFAPAGHMVATGCADGTIGFWDVHTASPYTIAQAHTAVVQGVAFSPDGRLFISGCSDKTLRIWQAEE